MSDEIIAIVEKDKYTNEISVLEYVQDLTKLSKHGRGKHGTQRDTKNISKPAKNGR